MISLFCLLAFMLLAGSIPLDREHGTDFHVCATVKRLGNVALQTSNEFAVVVVARLLRLRVVVQVDGTIHPHTVRLQIEIEVESLTLHLLFNQNVRGIVDPRFNGPKLFVHSVNLSCIHANTISQPS